MLASRTAVRIRRIASLATIVAVGLLALPASSAPRLRARDGVAKPGKLKSVAYETVEARLRPLGNQPAGKISGLPPIELNVDGFEGGDLRGLGFTTFKACFGNRFTLTADQAPFQLQVVAALLTQSDTGSGFSVGDPIEIAVLVDATASGNPANAIAVFHGEATVPTIEQISAFNLPEPIVVKQGDIYIMVADRRTATGDGSGTTLFWPDTEPAAGQRSFFAGAGDVANGNALLAWSSLQSDPPPVGNLIIRGFGSPADAEQNFTGGGQPEDVSIPAPTNLTAVGTDAVTLNWTAPTLPPPPDPDQVNETEPNDSPATGQMIGTNVAVMGSASSDDNGADGGFGGDDIEDWYVFTLTSPTSVTIDLTDFGNTDFDLLLYNIGGPFDPDSSVGQSGGGTGEEEHIVLDVLAAGTYAIAVTAFDPDVPSDTDYTLTVVAAPRVSRYNVFCGASETFTPSADTYIATVPATATTFLVQESAPGQYYRVTAVVGAAQSGPSNASSGSPCEGGPSVTSVKLKLNGNGSITLKGSGFVAGTTVTINGAATAAGKVKKQGRTFKIKGPLANGQPISSVVQSGQGYTIQIIAPGGGCTSVQGTARN